MKTFKLIKFVPNHRSKAEVLMCGIEGDLKDSHSNIAFAPAFELKLIREERVAMGEHCTELENWVFNVTETESNGSDVLFSYCIEEEILEIK